MAVPRDSLITSYTVSYVTDVEGNLNFFNRFVALSRALSYDQRGNLLLADGYAFVFGGDLFDKVVSSPLPMTSLMLY